jgi:hypothetical protein
MQKQELLNAELTLQERKIQAIEQQNLTEQQKLQVQQDALNMKRKQHKRDKKK